MEFRATYKDKQKVSGKVVPKCEWEKIDEREIEFLEFRIGNIVYTFGGFKKYNIKLQNVGFALNGILKIFVFARGKNQSFILSCERKEGGIEISEIKTKINHEYGNIKVNGWKNGELLEPYVVKTNMANKIIKGIYQENI